MSWSTSELRVRLAPLNRFKPSSKIFYWPFQGGTSFVDLLCFCSVLCLLCLCARLFICALWSPAGKGLTSWLCLGCLLWVCHFPIGILGQVWYLIVSFPDLCTFPYFEYTGLSWKVLENKICLENVPEKHSKALKSPWIYHLQMDSTLFFGSLNQYKIVVAPNKGTIILHWFSKYFRSRILTCKSVFFISFQSLNTVGKSFRKP